MAPFAVIVQFSMFMEISKITYINKDAYVLVHVILYEYKLTSFYQAAEIIEGLSELIIECTRKLKSYMPKVIGLLRQGKALFQH